MLHKGGTWTGAPACHECIPIFVLKNLVIDVLFYTSLFKNYGEIFALNKFAILEKVKDVLSFVARIIFAKLLYLFLLDWQVYSLYLIQSTRSYALVQADL